MKSITLDPSYSTKSKAYNNEIIMLLLYTKKGCPFCEKVLSAAGKLGITVHERNIADEENLKELMEKGGKRQVPFLIDTDANISIYESDDIVKYLKGTRM